MNQKPIQQIILSDFRSENELTELLEYLITFRQFRFLPDLPNHRQILKQLCGISLQRKSCVYSEGSANDKNVYFLLQGQVVKSFGNKRDRPGSSFLKKRENVFIESGDFFGCYEDELRFETVVCASNSLILKIKLDVFLQFSEKQKNTNLIKTQAIEKAFSGIKDKIPAEVLAAICKQAQLIRAINGETLIQTKNRLKQVEYTLPMAHDFFIPKFKEPNCFIMVDGTCDINCELLVDLESVQGQTAFSAEKVSKLTHNVFRAQKTDLIGDEITFTQKQFDKMTSKLPLTFESKVSSSSYISYAYTAKITSPIATLLVINIQDLRNTVPDTVMKKFLKSSKTKHKKIIQEIEQFLKYTVKVKPNLQHKISRGKKQLSPSLPISITENINIKRFAKTSQIKRVSLNGNDSILKNRAKSQQQLKDLTYDQNKQYPSPDKYPPPPDGHLQTQQSKRDKDYLQDSSFNNTQDSFLNTHKPKDIHNENYLSQGLRNLPSQDDSKTQTSEFGMTTSSEFKMSKNNFYQENGKNSLRRPMYHNYPSQTPNNIQEMSEMENFVKNSKQNSAYQQYRDGELRNQKIKGDSNDSSSILKNEYLRGKLGKYMVRRAASTQDLPDNLEYSYTKLSPKVNYRYQMTPNNYVICSPLISRPKPKTNSRFFVSGDKLPFVGADLVRVRLDPFGKELLTQLVNKLKKNNFIP